MNEIAAPGKRAGETTVEAKPGRMDAAADGSIDV